jgi:hypothetical protein
VEGREGEEVKQQVGELVEDVFEGGRKQRG